MPKSVPPLQAVHAAVGPNIPCGTRSSAHRCSARRQQPTRPFPDFINVKGRSCSRKRRKTEPWRQFAPTAFLRGWTFSDLVSDQDQWCASGLATDRKFLQQRARGSLISFRPTCSASTRLNNNLTPPLAPNSSDGAQHHCDPRSSVSRTSLPGCWINDGGTFNKGWRKMSGIDWTASYDFDAGDYGRGMPVLSVPITCMIPANGSGTDVVDGFHSTVASSALSIRWVETLPRMRYRARLAGQTVRGA